VAELPRGTVTFLFTDIEGSTRLLKQLGEQYGEVLEAHRRILREATEAREGREIDTQGDSFFFAFARANAALGAAVVAQRTLAEHDWPEGGEVRVRMGLHTGEPAVGEERYVGLGVHRAARIGAVAHGGQVLLSNATRELVEDEVGGVSVRDLGSYRLKDIDRPERLFQLDIEGLRTDFPPLRAEKVTEPHPLRRRAILLSALAGVIAAAVSIPIFALGQGGGGRSLEAAAGDSVGFVDLQSNRLVADVPVGTGPTAVTTGAGAAWVTNTAEGTVDRIDLATHTIRQTFSVGDGPSGIAFGDGSIWVTNGLSGTVSRIDPATNQIVRRAIHVGNDPVGIVFAAGSIWVANTGDDTITRIDVATSKPTETLRVSATELAYGAGTLWATQRAANRVARIDPSTGDTVGSIAVGNGPTGIAFGSGRAWVANGLDGTVSRIDPGTDVATAIPVGNGPTAVAVDRRGVWVSNQFDGTLVRIDPRTNQVARRISIGNRPQGVAISGGAVLVGVGQSGGSHRGGTLTVAGGIADVGPIDTALAYGTTSWALLKMTGDGLVAFNQIGGLAGSQLVPDLAVSLPTPTDGGKTYTFRLRANIRYSNGGTLKASDVRATFERDFKIAQLPVSYYNGIVGAAQCKKNPKRCDLSRGIVTNDAARTVTFHLVAADPEFLYKLALPFVYVLPAGTPAHDFRTRPLPATGPYVVASYRPEHRVGLVRNKYFREWSQAAQPDGYPDEIVVEIGSTADEAAKDVISGRADVFTGLGGPPSPPLLAEVEARFAGQMHSTPYLRMYGLFLNTRIAPFSSLDARRAMNYAADRAAAVKIAGGADVAQATCQILPPSMPGYRPYCPYDRDLGKARALVAASGTRGMKVTVWGLAQGRRYTDLGVKLLRSLGYRAGLKLISGPRYFALASDSRHNVQMGFTAWSSDYPVASGFFTPLLTCASFLPGSPLNSNASGFCDPRIDRELKRALAEQTSNPQAAKAILAQVDRQIVDEAPYVPLVNPKIINVLSKRVGNFQFSPMWSLLIDQLWVR
jgi:YVTN family beta-propeller protein